MLNADAEKLNAEAEKLKVHAAFQITRVEAGVASVKRKKIPVTIDACLEKN